MWLTSFLPHMQRWGMPGRWQALSVKMNCPLWIKGILEFGKAFESRFVGQGQDENRSIQETLDIGWELLHMLPGKNWIVSTQKLLEQYYPAEEKA